VYIIDYKKKEHHHHRHSHDKKKSTTNGSSDFPVLSTELRETSLTKRQKAALEKLEKISNKARNQTGRSHNEILKAVADATTKVLSDAKSFPTLSTKAVSQTTVSDQGIPVDSPEIDPENEPIHKKRQRQRSLVLNLGKISNHDLSHTKQQYMNVVELRRQAKHIFFYFF
jgi:hypothetical protein